MSRETPAGRAALARAADWFVEELQGQRGESARTYATARGVTPESLTTFQVGFAPEGDRLKIALAEFGEDLLLDCGLLGRAADRNACYDRFRGRLMFPIRDGQGRVAGFGGRTLETGTPKYLNSPESAYFRKGQLLYNLTAADPIARASGRLIIVEGYLDVVALTQAGFGETVAPLGTALTSAQLGLLWNVAAEPTLCFDGDGAGRRASLRAARIALPLLKSGFGLKFAQLGDGLDPDTLVQGGGAKAVDACLNAAVSLVDLLWQSECAVDDLSTPERRAALQVRLRGHVAAARDKNVAATLSQTFKDRFRDKFETQRFAPVAPAVRHVVADSDALTLLAALSTRSHLAKRLSDTLSRIRLTDDETILLRAALMAAADEGRELDLAELGRRARLARPLFARVSDAGLEAFAEQLAAKSAGR